MTDYMSIEELVQRSEVDMLTDGDGHYWSELEEIKEHLEEKSWALKEEVKAWMLDHDVDEIVLYGVKYKHFKLCAEGLIAEIVEAIAEDASRGIENIVDAYIEHQLESFADELDDDDGFELAEGSDRVLMIALSFSPFNLKGCVLEAFSAIEAFNQVNRHVCYMMPDKTLKAKLEAKEAIA